MTDWTEVSGVRLIRGDCLDVMRTLPDASVDAVVTDPPAGIAFMGKDWDAFPRDAFIEFLFLRLVEARRIVKPGGYMLCWALPRTSHWTGTAIEQAGWTIRDRISHLFGTGFPKSSSCLKPGGEDWWLAKAPGELRPLGIDACRIPANGEINPSIPRRLAAAKSGKAGSDMHSSNRVKHGLPAFNKDVARYAADRPSESLGRWPANVVLSHDPDCNGECVEGCPVRMIGEQAGERRSGEPGVRKKPAAYFRGINITGQTETGYADTGTAARFYYTAKASKSDKGDYNTHPTIKSTDLMGWLIKLVCPEGGTVLDPFAGSGSTAVAAYNTGRRCVGIERDPGYFGIACRRVQEAADATPLFKCGSTRRPNVDDDA